MKNLRHLAFALILSLAALFSAGHAEARTLVIDLAESSVDITTGFTGARLVVFGTKKQSGEVAIVISGPATAMVVRHKEENLGIWMNTESVVFNNVPVYYDYALSAPVLDLAPPDALKRLGIGLNALNFIHTGREEAAVVESFSEALIRNKQAQGHFPLEPEPITFLDPALFRTAFYLPANVPTGQYLVKAYLFSEGEVVEQQETRLRVAQVGFNARLFNFSHQRPWLYGLVAVFLPVLAGLAAYFFLRRK